MGTRKEEVEHYYKNNPSKPYHNPTQYKKPIGPEHPHANVKEGKKELGPTRDDLERHEQDVEKERQRKFRVNFEIEREVNAARLRQEKADERAAQKAAKKSVEEPEKESPHQPLSKRIGRGVLGMVDAVGPNPFAMSKSQYKNRPQINSGFSAGGFPSFGGRGFGNSGLSPAKFPAFSMGGGFGKQKGGGMSSGLGGGLGLGSGMKFGGSPFASSPSPKKHRRRRPTKRRHKR